MPTLEEQVAEVQLIQASTNEEEFHWRGSEGDVKAWNLLVASTADVQDNQTSPLSFALRLTEGESNPDLWLNVDYPVEESDAVQLTLQGPSVSRDDLDRVNKIINERRSKAEKEGFENVVFDIFTAIQAYLSEEPLQAAMEVNQSSRKEEIESIELNRHVKMSRVIFWTHHLKAPSKKRDITAWCAELRLWGLVKSGYPGYLSFEGQQTDAEEMVRRIKSLQWHAITLKTDERYIYQASLDCTTTGEIQQEAIRHCLLAKGHSAAEQIRSDRLAKVRTTMDEVESGKEFVERLKAASIPEEEYMTALNLRKGGLTHG